MYNEENQNNSNHIDSQAQKEMNSKQWYERQLRISDQYEELLAKNIPPVAITAKAAMLGSGYETAKIHSDVLKLHQSIDGLREMINRFGQ